MSRDMLRNLPRRQLVVITIGLQLANLLSGLDASIVATAMPRIIAEMSGVEYYAWVTTAYLVGSATMIPIAGKLGDLFGRKVFVLVGLIGFLAASMLCGFSQNMLQLVLFRAIQGTFGGVLTSSVLSSIGDLFLPATRARLQGLFVSVMAVATIVGPSLGGVLTDGLGWRWVFFVNLPVGIVAAAVLTLNMPRIRSSASRADVDVAGALLLAGAVVAALVALSVLPEHGWTSPLVLGLVAVTVASVAALIRVERGHAHPMVPFEIFRNRTVAVGIAASFLGMFGMLGSNLYIPLVYQGVIGLSATGSGLLLAPRALAMVASSLLTGQIVSRIGRYRWIGVGGMTCMTIGLVLLSQTTPTSSPADVVRDSILIGIGAGANIPIFSNSVMSAVPYRFLGVASSQVVFARSVGQAVGVAALGSVLSARLPEEIAARTSALPDGVRQLLPVAGSDPESLFDPARLDAVRGQLGPAAAPAFDQLVASLREALSHSLEIAFLVAAAGTLVGILVTALLREVPFRSRAARGEVVEGVATPPE